MLETVAPEAATEAFRITSEFFESVESRHPAEPQARPIPAPIPTPLWAGSRFMIWEQNATAGTLESRLTYIPQLVLDGPCDTRLDTQLPGITPVVRNVPGDFIFVSGTAQSDCAHTFAVARQTLTMYQRLCAQMPMMDERLRACPWAWNQNGNVDVLTCHPHGFEGANAFYSRNSKALRFGYFLPQAATEKVYTCRSFDTVAHHMGHAILDGWKPGWLAIGNPPQTGALHESFADLTAIFLSLTQLNQVETFVSMTKADLHRKNFLAALAEEFGEAVGRPMGLRNADNDLKLSQASNEVNDISRVFTGAIYDVLADIYTFEKNRQRATKDPAQVLLEANQHVCKLLVNAILQAPAVGATFADIVNKMLQTSHYQGDPAIYRTFIRNRFSFREVVASPAPLTAMATGRIEWENPAFVEGEDTLSLAPAMPQHASLLAPQDRSACCGTMQLPEYAQDQQKLDADLRRLMEPGRQVPAIEILQEEIDRLRETFAWHS